MFLMLDGMYTVGVFLEGGELANPTTHNFLHVLARCFDLCFLLSLLLAGLYFTFMLFITSLSF